MKMLNKKGFTLIELLVVIAIIGILSSVVLVSLNSARQKANAAKATGDLSQIMTAFEMAKSDGTTEAAAIATIAAGTCPVAPAAVAIIGANGTQYLKLPCAPTGIAYTVTNGTVNAYNFSATLPDGGVFTCTAGACTCSSGTLCKQ